MDNGDSFIDEIDRINRMTPDEAYRHSVATLGRADGITDEMDAAARIPEAEMDEMRKRASAPGGQLTPNNAAPAQPAPNTAVTDGVGRTQFGAYTRIVDQKTGKTTWEKDGQTVDAPESMVQASRFTNPESRDFNALGLSDAQRERALTLSDYNRLSRKQRLQNLAKRNLVAVDGLGAAMEDIYHSGKVEEMDGVKYGVGMLAPDVVDKLSEMYRKTGQDEVSRIVARRRIAADGKFVGPYDFIVEYKNPQNGSGRTSKYLSERNVIDMIGDAGKYLGDSGLKDGLVKKLFGTDYEAVVKQERIAEEGRRLEAAKAAEERRMKIDENNRAWIKTRADAAKAVSEIVSGAGGGVLDEREFAKLVLSNKDAAQIALNKPVLDEQGQQKYDDAGNPMTEPRNRDELKTYFDDLYSSLRMTDAASRGDAEGLASMIFGRSEQPKQNAAPQAQPTSGQVDQNGEVGDRVLAEITGDSPVRPASDGRPASEVSASAPDPASSARGAMARRAAARQSAAPQPAMAQNPSPASSDRGKNIQRTPVQQHYDSINPEVMAAFRAAFPVSEASPYDVYSGKYDAQLRALAQRMGDTSTGNVLDQAAFFRKEEASKASEAARVERERQVRREMEILGTRRGWSQDRIEKEIDARLNPITNLMPMP